MRMTQEVVQALSSGYAAYNKHNRDTPSSREGAAGSEVCTARREESLWPSLENIADLEIRGGNHNG